MTMIFQYSQMGKKIVRPRRKKYINKTTFSKAYADEVKHFKSFLVKYLDIYNDSYFYGLLKKMIKDIVLEEKEAHHIIDLIDRIDLDIMLIDSIIGLGHSQNLEDRISKVMKCPALLKGWDFKFIYGNNNDASILSQLQANGSITEKQLFNLNRIEIKLGLHRVNNG